MRYKVRPKKEFIIINGETFSKLKNINREYVIRQNYNSLEYCYARPSQAKHSIFYDWKNIFLDSVEYDLIRFGIRGYNCNVFSLNAIVENKETKKQYYIYITKTRQEIQEIE